MKLVLLVVSVAMCSAIQLSQFASVRREEPVSSDAEGNDKKGDCSACHALGKPAPQMGYPAGHEIIQAPDGYQIDPVRVVPGLPYPKDNLLQVKDEPTSSDATENGKQEKKTNDCAACHALGKPVPQMGYPAGHKIIESPDGSQIDPVRVVPGLPYPKDN
eukprot:CAMPEP_0175160876 /NCGR_PEP_ID=MMETSP0087-20121206/24276_1 /TAXON_ID=136419 /ORGANISM="Unknown Unknown, Strain D1" /LENGTH=159 /DNA_ID=CAMNT_0016449195 /DNA_START=17 /DNA_END=496 /DNA_ORIENTATION=+